MIDHEIHHELHVARAEVSDELVHIRQRAVTIVNVCVVRDVIAHVYLRAFVYCRVLARVWYDHPVPTRREPDHVNCSRSVRYRIHENITDFQDP
jgi:hypothetical protein